MKEIASQKLKKLNKTSREVNKITFYHERIMS